MGPLLGRGFVLSYDMVFVPRYRWSIELLGISEQLPRSVPVEAILAALARVAPMDVVQKAILLGLLVVAFVGTGRLVPSDRFTVRVAAGVLYCWNPFVYERLLIGHWPLLVSYAALPWIARAAIDLRSEVPNAGRRLALWVAAASFASPFGAVTAAIMAVAISAAPPWDRRFGQVARVTGTTLAIVILMNLPWLVPAILRPSGLPASPRAFDAFRARSDSPLGLAGSLLSLGGMWNTDLAPPGRETWLWVPSFALIASVVVIGWARLRRLWPGFAFAGLLIGAALGLVTAGALGLPGLGSLARWVLLHVPGGGLLRDSQRYLAPLALASAVGFGVGLDRILSSVERVPQLATVTLLIALLLPVALAPTLAWGARGRLGTSRYPPSWSEARRIMSDDPQPGRVLVLPWHQFFPMSWNGNRVVLDPAQRFFSRSALTPGRLELRSGPVPPEEPLLATADTLVDSGRAFADIAPELGARYVLVLKEADWTTLGPRLGGLEEVFDAPALTLFRSGKPPATVDLARPLAWPVVMADVLALGALLAMLISAARPLVSRGLSLISSG
jgi:hypothetical protein